MSALRLQACSAAVVALVALVPLPALALWGDRLEIYGQENVVYDSNIFRLSDQRASAIGINEKSDTYYVTTLGLNLNLPVSRQIFRLGVALNDTRFDRYKQLNFTGHDLNAAWLWQAGNNWSGTVGYTNVKTLVSFTNILSTVPSTVEYERAYASANWLVTPRWRLGALVDERQKSYSDPGRQANELEATGAEGSLTYLTPRGNSIGLNHRTEEGRFPNQVLVGGVAANSGYTQDTTVVVVDWTVTPVSHLNYRAGVMKRKYDQQIPGFANRDFDGLTGRITYDWSPTERFTLSAVALREISAIEDIETSFVVLKGVAVRPTWKITEKTTLAGTLDSTRRTYHGDPTVPQRDEKVHAAGLILTWQALRNLQVAGALLHEKRTSNLPGLDYTFTQASVRARIGF